MFTVYLFKSYLNHTNKVIGYLLTLFNVHHSLYSALLKLYGFQSVTDPIDVKESIETNPQ